ncbi:MAG: hypothetical protein LAT81_13600, partial [Oceanicaulis sp.]|nr:hypothetical protein [Oceanicaulis sp.]
MKQKLQLLIAILFACTSLVTAQSDASVQGNMHVHLGGNLAFFGALDVPVAGLLRNEAGSLFTRSTISGEERIQMDEAANLDIANGTFTFRNEIDEKFTNLTIASNGIVEVVPGNSLEISGTLANHNSTMTDSLAGVNLYANSSGYAQLLTSGGISVPGTVFAQQFLTSTTTAGWRELSSPVNTTLSEVADDYPLYFNNTGSSRQWNVWWYDAQPATSNTGADNPISNISKANAQYYKPANSNDAFSGDRA